MADSKITALAALTTADPANDMFPVVDVSDTSMAASGTTKRISINNILACSPSATLASATITGDLTVATDRLKVVTGSTAVQIGATTQTQFGTTAWPTSYIGKSGSRVLIGSAGELILWNEAAAAIGNNSTLHVGAKAGPSATIIAGGAIKGGIENTSDYSGFLTLSTQRSDASMIERYRIDSTGVATWSNVGGVAGTAMTLNATGLGVGRSPISKLTVDKASQTPGGTTPNGALVITDTVGSNLALEFGVNSAALPWIQSRNSTTGTYYDLLLNPNGGNVGIGAVPSASKLQVAGNIGLPNSCTASGETSGVFSIDVANLLTLTGSNWRQASILIVYSGIDGAATNATVLQTVVTLSGLSTWNTIAKNDIVGTASVAVSASTTTGATITFTVPTGNTGSVYAMLLGGGGSTTLPSMTINA